MRLRPGVIVPLAALLLGAAAAALLRPAWLERRALAAIADPAGDVRRRGWLWLEQPQEDAAGVRAAARLEPIATRLGRAGDDAVLDGGDALRRLGLWGWDRLPAPLVLRETHLRAAGAEDERHLALDSLADAPLDLAPDALAPVFALLIAGEPAAVREAAFRAAAAWAGPERGDFIRALPVPEDDVALNRLRDLTLAFTQPPPPPAPIDSDAPAARLETQLLARVLAAPDDASVVLDALRDERAAGGDPRPCFEYILRHARGPAAEAALRRLAESGSSTAAFALQARSPEREAARAEAVACDPTRPPPLRRLAAWRWDAIPPERLAEILDLDPTEPDGSVYAASLLAERRLDPSAAAARSEAWIRSFNDDEKRAGALLAALLGAHRTLLRHAYDIENEPAVRTTQRLALWALGEDPGPEEPVELAHRALHAPGGDFRPDTALCMLLADRPEVLARLVSPPAGGRAAVQARAWLIERFVPAWHERLGRPIGGDLCATRLHFEALDALEQLDRRRIVFDPVGRRYGMEQGNERSRE